MILNAKHIRDLYGGLKAFEAAMYAYHERKSYYVRPPSQAAAVCAIIKRSSGKMLSYAG